MAKNVVLKDADGNELNAGKLYKHNIRLSYQGERVFALSLELYTTKNIQIDTFGKLTSYYQGDIEICTVIYDENEEMTYPGFIAFIGGTLFIGNYNGEDVILNEEYSNLINNPNLTITDTSIPV